MARQNPNPPLDRDLLHRVWFRRAGRSGKLKIVQTEWADLLDVTNNTISRIMKEMTADGRIRKIGYCLYAITEPEQEVDGEVSTDDGDSEPQGRVPLWG